MADPFSMKPALDAVARACVLTDGRRESMSPGEHVTRMRWVGDSQSNRSVGQILHKDGRRESRGLTEITAAHTQKTESEEELDAHRRPGPHTGRL